MVVQARSLQNWATEVNKMLATGTPMLIGDILTRSLALKKELQNKKVCDLPVHPFPYDAVGQEGPEGGL